MRFFEKTLTEHLETNQFNYNYYVQFFTLYLNILSKQ